MKKVTQEYFYRKIGSLNAVISLEGNYTINFKTRGGILLGKVIESYKSEEKKFPTIKTVLYRVIITKF